MFIWDGEKAVPAAKAKEKEPELVWDGEKAVPVKKKDGGVVSTSGSTGGQTGLSTSDRDQITAYLNADKSPEQRKKEIADAVSKSKPLVQAPVAKKTYSLTKPITKDIHDKAAAKIDKIMYGSGEGWKDPLKEIQNQLQNAKDPDEFSATLHAYDLAKETLAPDGFEAKQILNNTIIGEGDKDNQTTSALRRAADKYEASVAPLKEIQVGEGEDLSAQDEETLHYRYLTQLKNAAVKKHINDHADFARQVSEMGLDVNDPLLAQKIPNVKMGYIMDEFLNDPDINTYLSKEDSRLKPAIDYAREVNVIDNPDYGTNVVANEVSRALQKSGFNAIDPVFHFDTDASRQAANLAAEELYKDDPVKLKIYNDNIRDNQQEYLDKPSFFTSVAQAGKDVVQGIGSTVTALTNSKSDDIKEKWIQEASHVSADPKGVVKVMRDIGHATGFVATLAAGGELAMGTKLITNPATAQKVLIGASFFGDELKEAEMKYKSPVKAWLSATINTGAFMYLSNIFPASKVNEALRAGKPALSQVAENLASGKITQEAAKQAVSNIFKQTIDFGKKAFKQNIKTASEMAALAGMREVMDRVFNLDEQTLNKYYADGHIRDTFTSMFLSNSLVAGVTAYGAMRNGNRAMENSLFEAASNPKRMERVIEEMGTRDQNVNVNELTSNLKYLEGVKADLDKQGISEKNQKRYLYESIRNKVLRENAEKTPDANITRQGKEEIKRGEEIMDGILRGEEAEEVVTTEKEKEQKETLSAEADRNKLIEKGNKAIDKLLEEKDENDKPVFKGIYRDIAKADPVGFLEEIAQQAHGIDKEGNPLKGGGREVDMIPQYGADVINVAKELFPKPKKSTISVIMPEEVKKPDTTTIAPKKKEESLPDLEISVDNKGKFSGGIVEGKEVIGEGSEHTVYADGDKVIKVGEPYASDEPFEARVNDAKLINEIVGDGTLELIGTYKSKNGAKNPVYSQKHIEGEPATPEEVKALMEEKGFTPVEGKKDTYVGEHKGKTYEISDIEDNFVKDKSGKIVGIDASIKEIKNDGKDNTKGLAETSEANEPKPTKEADEKFGKEDSGQPPISEPPKPPKPPVAEGAAESGGGGKKELDKLANNIPDSGKVAEYMSKDTIEKYTGEAPTNDQSRGVQELQIALEHGEKIIDKAKELFGKDYAEKTLEYIENSTAGVSNKALMYVSLENALGREKIANPEKAADLTKQQALVYERSQAFARENSLALNYQKLRRIAKAGYDLEKVTDSFFSSEEIEAKGKIKKAIEADAEAINEEAKQQATAGITPEIEKKIQEGVEKEISKLYEALPGAKKSYADRAIKALEEVQKKLRGRAYDATIGIPVAMIDAGITTIKNAIKVGSTVANAVEAGIKKIKELYGKPWENEDKFRQDALGEFNKHIGASVKEQVRDALIQKGFGVTITVDGKKKEILDWKKLAGAAGTTSKISENVADVLKAKGASEAEFSKMQKEFIDEYIDLRFSVIEKAQAELARRNKEGVSPDQKSAAKKLAELYAYGLFEKNAEEFDVAINKAFGSRVNQETLNEAKKIAKGLETIFATSFKGGKLNDISAKSAIDKLENQLRVLLAKESKKEGNFPLRAANIVRNYFEIQQTMLLNNLKQAMENPLSGLQQNLIDKIDTNISGSSTGKLADQRRKVMKDVFKNMVLEGGVGYGGVESTFSNRQHLDDYVNKVSDNKLYHGVMALATGKITLNAMDAMWKAGITEKKFTGNLVKILTHPTNPKKMSKEEAVKFVSENLTGQTYKDAQATAKEVITKINKDAGEELIPMTSATVDRFANDIVKSALEMGNKISKEQIEAAYNAAYKSAGLGLGHEANNILSATIKGYSGKIENDIQRAVKEKEWNRAALLTLKGVLFRNIINPFVGGGTNWLVLKFEKTGLGLFTGLGYQLGSNSRIDMSSEVGMRKLEQRLYNQARIKDNYMRGAIGGVASMLLYLSFLGLANTDDYRKWRRKNPWAARYLDVVTPEVLLSQMAIENKDVKKYVMNTLNKNDAFDASTKLIKAAEFASKGKTKEAWGALGESVGSKVGLPLPWRLVKDGQVLYQGVKGQDPYHGNYKPSRGFWNGAFQGGAIEWLGFRPPPKK